MNTVTKVAPSILSADFACMGEEIRRMQAAGADLIHCDVMDGVFVKNITFGPKMIADVRKHTELPLDVHLMIVDPEKYIENFALSGADYISIHYEACNVLSGTLKRIRELKVKSGLVVNPETPIEVVEPYMELCDLILVMSVHPGFGGQSFIESSLNKLSWLKERKEKTELSFAIEVDGGVNTENAAVIRNAGAEIIVAGNAVFKAASAKQAIDIIRG